MRNFFAVASGVAFVFACGAPGEPTAPPAPPRVMTDAAAPNAAVDAAPQAACAEEVGDACEQACRAGGFVECSWYVNAARDDREKLRRGVISCDAAKGHGEREALFMCGFAWSACREPPDVAACNRLIDATCTIAITSSDCVGAALAETRSTFDPKRAERVLDALAACRGPKCSYTNIILAKAPFHSKERALSVASAIEARCAAGEARACQEDAYFVMDPKAEHFDPARAASVADSLEKLCSKESPDACDVLFWARKAKGPAPKPARAFEIADMRCTLDVEQCGYLASCFEDGGCGKPKDLKRAISLLDRACAKTLSTHAGWTRAEPYNCRHADELKVGTKKK